MTQGDSVSMRDIYEAVQRLEDKMGQRIDKVEADVDGLKGFQNKALGILSVFSVFVSAIASFIWNKITGEGN